MANPSLQIGNGKWAIKEDSLLGYTELGNNIAPVEIDMTRASAGTRVNPQGLVETVELLGSEDVVNEDFATDLSGWIDSTSDTFEQVSSWQGESGLMHIVTSAANRGARQTSVYTLGVLHKFTAKLWIVSGGVYFGKSTDKIGGVDYTTIGEWIDISVSFNPTADSTLRAYTVGSGEFYLDNISVKESTVNNLARVNYTGSTSSLLAEPQRTNLIPYSSEYTAVNGWDITGAIITTNQAISPDGTLTADLVELDTSTDRFAEIINSASGGTYTFSFYVKAKAGESGNWTSYCVGDTSASIVTFIDDSAWVRVSKTFTKTGAGNLIVYPAYRLNSNTVFDAYIWGAQLEQGSYATSYIPTSGSTVTRNQDQFSRDGISSLINSEEGVLFIEGSALIEVGADNRHISISSGSNNDRLYFYYSTSGKFAFASFVGGVLQANITYDGIITNNSKVACKWKLNDYSLWIDGIERGIDTNASVWSSGTLDTLNFADANGAGSNFYGKVKQLQVFKTALTDSELIALTS